MKAHVKYSSLISVLILLVGVGLWSYGFATTDTYNTPTNLGAPGALPPCVTANGTSGSDALVITLPKGFVPTYMKFVPHYNSTAAATEGGEWEFLYGMTDNYDAVGHVNGSTAENHSTGSYFDMDTSAGTVTIPAAAQVNTGNYLFRACQ